MKAGDLVRIAGGRYGTIVNGPYTHRFMDAEDHEMVAHGMGHLAGRYGSAVDVSFTKTGRIERVPVDSRLVVISKDER